MTISWKLKLLLEVHEDLICLWNKCAPTSAVLFLFFACSIFGLQEINVTILMNIWITIVLLWSFYNVADLIIIEDASNKISFIKLWKCK